MLDTFWVIHFKLVYFPLMVYSFSLNSSILNNKRVAAVFILNSLLASAAAYLHEKKYYDYIT